MNYVYLLSDSAKVAECAALAAALVGMGIQFTLRAREIGKKEVRHAQAVKEEISKEAEVEQMRALVDDDEDEEEE